MNSDFRTQSRFSSKRGGWAMVGLIVLVVAIAIVAIFYFIHRSATNGQSGASSADQLDIAGKKLLANLGPEVGGYPNLQIGPVVMALHERLQTLKVYAPDLDYLDTLAGSVDIKISSVMGVDGNEMLDKQSSLETDPFFTAPDMRLSHDPILYLEGNRNISIVSAEYKTPIAKITGTISLSIPDQISSTTFNVSANQIENETPVSSSSLISVSLDDPETVNVTTSGDLRDVLNVRAYNDAGNEISRNIIQHLNDGYSIGFNAENDPISKIVVYSTNHLVVTPYQFTLVVPSSSAVSSGN